MRRRSLLVTGCGVIAAIALAVMGGAAVAGQAASTQQVAAALTCQPETVKPGNTVGCVLTVSNNGGNNVNQVVVTDEAPGGTFLPSSSSLCDVGDGADADTLTCEIGKLTAVGTPGATFTETHELQTPSSGTSLVQTVNGRFSPNKNNRASDTIAPVTEETNLNPSADFDGTFANADGEDVQTGELSSTNPYSTGASVLGTTFAVGLTVLEQSAGNSNVNCPNGCLGGQVIQFDITPLDGVTFPESYELTALISGLVVPNNKKAQDIVVRHEGEIVPLCPDTDPTDSCVVSKTIQPSTKIATIKIEGPGDGNGGWGFG